MFVNDDSRAVPMRGFVFLNTESIKTNTIHIYTEELRGGAEITIRTPKLL